MIRNNRIRAAAVCLALACFPGGRLTAASVLADNQPPDPAYIGIHTAPLDAAMRTQLKLDDRTGLLIADVDPHGPAAAKLRRHDVLLNLNGQVLFNPPQLNGLVHTLRPGDTVALNVMRQSQTQVVTVTLGSRSPLTPPATSRSAPADTTPGGSPTDDAASAGLTAERRMQIESIIDDIRDTDRASVPMEAVSEDDMERFIDRVRERLVDAYVNPVTARESFMPRPETVEPAWSAEDIAESRSLAFEDGARSAELSLRDGTLFFNFEDEKGNIIFQGPIDTPEQRKRIPGEALKYLDYIENREGGMGADYEWPSSE